MDCDLFVPTAGRDSLDAGTTKLLGEIGAVLENLAVETILISPERIAQHTRIFRFIVGRDLINKMDNVPVRLADGTEIELKNIKQRANEGKSWSILRSYTEACPKSSNAGSRSYSCTACVGPLSSFSRKKVTWKDTVMQNHLTE